MGMGDTAHKRKAYSLKEIFRYERVVRNIPMLLLLTALAVFYIWNRNHAYRQMLELERTKKELKELNWEFSTAKKELNNKSMQTQVAKKVHPLGLKDLSEPPYKIEVE
jgi:cell division protein FtsL